MQAVCRRALSSQCQGDDDLGQRVRGVQEAHRVALEAGDLSQQAAAEHNLCLTYSRLGLNYRAWRVMRHSIALREPGLIDSARVNIWGIASIAARECGELKAARHATALALRAHATERLPKNQNIAIWFESLDLHRDNPRRALELARLIAGRERGWGLANYLWTLAQQELATSHHAAALRASTRSTRLQQARRGRLGGGATSDAALWWTHHRALLANGKTAAAHDAIATAYALLVQGVSPLSDEGLRRSYLQQAFGEHAKVLRAWLNEARTAGLPRERFTTHLRGATHLQEAVQRLVDTGLRLNEQTTSAALQAFLIEEVAELLGARRVLLVLETADGPHIAGAQVPTDETPAALLQAITPWLDEARRTRQTTLRHGPEGADELDQRGCLVAPLVAQQQLLGFIYADLDGLFGRLHAGDRDLLATLASQAAVALANLRTQEGLERQVAERTAALEQRTQQAQQLLVETEARNAELAVINSIQQGLAGQLDFQAITDLVGDKLREVLTAYTLTIVLLDRDRAQFLAPYFYSQGKRHTPAPWPVGGIGGRVVRTLQPAAFATVADAEAASKAESGGGNRVVDALHPPESMIYMPLVSSGEAIGLLCVGKLAQAAFSTADVNLVATIAASLSVALQNARNFEAERQRAAELAIINAVQQALACELSLQGVYEAVGQKLRDMFPGSFLGVRIIDRAAGMEHYPYCYYDDQRLHLESKPLTDLGFGAYVVRTGKTHVVNERMDEASAAFGAGMLADVTMPKSQLMVPLVTSGQVRGLLQLSNVQREHAYGPGEVRLLETLAASMSVALENARLFDETQRLLNETERRSAELAVINTIQQGMAREMNFRAIVELVGDKLREVFASNDISIHGADLKTLRAQALYVVERGQRLSLPDYRMDPTQPVVQQSMRGEVVLARNPAEIAQVMGPTVETLDTEVEPFPGTHQSKTIVWVPINPSPDRLYALVLESADRKDAFSAADIALLQTVAASMGLALENARLFDETQAALQRQTASADILRVISQSPTDVRPVFDGIVTAAVQLLVCDFTVIMSSDGRTYSPVSGATREGPMLNIGLPNQPLDPAANFPSRAIVGKTMLHLPDWSAIDLPPHAQFVHDTLSVRSALYLPLLRGDECVGLLVFGANRPRVFSAQEIFVAESFRDQALIAIENTRLFNETKEALERQTATAEVLQVIGRSMADAQPVFEAIVDSCTRLFRSRRRRGGPDR